MDVQDDKLIHNLLYHMNVDENPTPCKTQNSVEMVSEISMPEGKQKPKSKIMSEKPVDIHSLIILILSKRLLSFIYGISFLHFWEKKNLVMKQNVDFNLHNEKMVLPCLNIICSILFLHQTKHAKCLSIFSLHILLTNLLIHPLNVCSYKVDICCSKDSLKNIKYTLLKMYCQCSVVTGKFYNMLCRHY